MKTIKYLILDVDGTLTDGKIYMGTNGETMKAFSVKDGYAINYILKRSGIEPVILTARNSLIVKKRCEELGIERLYQGRIDKLEALNEILGNSTLEECAYFGDDMLDLTCMESIQRAGGIAGCPADAIHEVKAAADYTCVNKAGEGALREFAEWLISEKTEDQKIHERVNKAIKFIQNLSVSENEIGKHVVDDVFFYYVQGYDTKTANQYSLLESHRRYVDIQLIVKGSEIFEIADTSRLTLIGKYDDVSDAMFWNIPKRMVRVTLKEGDYIVLYPENAHRGAMSINSSEKVLKIVGKVKIE